MKKTLIAALAIVAVCGCAKKDTEQQIPVVPVKMTKAEKKTMPVQITAVGTIDAYNKVDIIPRVEGQIERMPFKEGQEVKKGDLLVEIDKDTYQQKVNQAEAQLKQDLSALEFDKADAERYTNLLKEGAVATADAQQHQTTHQMQEQTVNADKAALQQAKLNLGYCDIRSPIDGVTSSYLANIGAIVSQNQTKILTVTQIKPIYVTFSVPEKFLPAIRTAMSKGNVEVRATPAGGTEKTGKLTFIDNTVDSNTGMIMLKATFPNADKQLWPGQFAQVVLKLSEQMDAVVVPSNAVVPGDNGKAYVYLVGPDNVVKHVEVTVDRTVGTQSVISAGLTGAETIVLDGQLKLRDGFKVSESPIQLEAVDTINDGN
ncbi:MAG: efflux RND transporter periplasmic adaptor subunit [Elusimicrobiaceae bacterium]